MFNEEEPGNGGRDSASERNSTLRPLQRLRQLAGEIEQGLAHDNLELVCQAASLLGPTLTQWNTIHDTLPVSAGEAAQLAIETRQTLTRCETDLLLTMARMSEELKRMRQGRQQIQALRQRSASQGRLDDLR